MAAMLWRLLVLLLVVLLLTCDSENPPSVVVVYTSLDEHYSRPILEEFERSSGIRVLARYDTEADKTTGLFRRLLAERSRPHADLFWNSEVLRTVLLARENVLAPGVPAIPEFPAWARDPDGRWSGFAARARVFLYNTTRLKPADAPRFLEDLTLPRHKGRAAMALPLFGTTATHVGALRATLGRERMEWLLKKIKENGVRIVQGNAQVRDLVVAGDVDFGLTDSDDAHEALRAGKPVAIVFPDQESPIPGKEEALGTCLIPNTIGLVAGGPHQREARALAEFLLSAPVEERLSRSGSAQIPLRSGVPLPEGLRLPTGLKTMEVDFAAAARGLEEAEPFLRDLFVR